MATAIEQGSGIVAPNATLNIDDEHSGTCQWLLETPQWLQWQDSLDQLDIPRLLWLKGKAGTGKSTVIKYASERGYRPVEGEIILIHFFNARGTDLERSAEGMYRMILTQ